MGCHDLVKPAVHAVKIAGMGGHAVLVVICIASHALSWEMGVAQCHVQLKLLI